MKKIFPFAIFAITAFFLIGFVVYLNSPANNAWADPVPPEYTSAAVRVEDMQIGETGWIYNLTEFKGRVYVSQFDLLDTDQGGRRVLLEKTEDGIYATIFGEERLTFYRSTSGPWLVGVKINKPPTADDALLYQCSPGKVDTAGNIPVECGEWTITLPDVDTAGVKMKGGTMTITPAEPHAKHGGPTTPCEVGQVEWSVEGGGLLYVCTEVDKKNRWSPMGEGDSGVADNNVIIKGNTYAPLPVEKNQ